MIPHGVGLHIHEREDKRGFVLEGKYRFQLDESDSPRTSR
jgi:hypothetical protein